MQSYTPGDTCHCWLECEPWMGLQDCGWSWTFPNLRGWARLPPHWFHPLGPHSQIGCWKHATDILLQILSISAQQVGQPHKLIEFVQKLKYRYPFFLVHPHDFSLKIATRTCFRTNTNIHCLQHFFLQLFLTNLEQSSWIYNEIYRLIFVVVFYIIHSFIPFPVNLLLQIYNRYIFL